MLDADYGYLKDKFDKQRKEYVKLLVQIKRSNKYLEELNKELSGESDL